MTTYIWRDIRMNETKMLQCADTQNGREVCMPNGEMRIFGKHELLPDDAFTRIQEPQALLDELLKAGIRPSSNAWSSGHVAALEKHIAFAERVADRLLDSPAKTKLVDER